MVACCLLLLLLLLGLLLLLRESALHGLRQCRTHILRQIGILSSLLCVEDEEPDIRAASLGLCNSCVLA